MNHTTPWGNSPRILVVGDLILDRYTIGDVVRISPESPVPVLDARDDEIRPGGAASAARLVAALGGTVVVAGMVGADREADALRAVLSEAGVETSAVLTSADRTTTVKHRLLGRVAGRPPQPLLRVDREERGPLSPHEREQLLEGVSELLVGTDALLLSDYAKGVCEERFVAQLIELAERRSCPVLVDPGRGVPLSRYRGATVLKPNRAEAELLSGDRIDTIEVGCRIAERLQRDTGAVIYLTLDADGIVLADGSDSSCHVPAERRDVCDITGAGDTVLAMLGVCLAAGQFHRQAAEFANRAAGRQVERIGVSPITWADLDLPSARGPASSHGKIVSAVELMRIGDAARSHGQRIVFTNGCFDLLHPGHLSMLRAARAQGDVLIVAINGDASVAALKGPGRPVCSAEHRAELLAALAIVDYVVVFDDPTPEPLLHSLRPDVLVKGGTTGRIVGAEIVEAYGGTVMRTGTVPGVSTTSLIARQRESHDQPVETGGVPCA
jgi:D-beta-D-heptose 7-phosphate kinase/D-beta-D-heptose 1-phosphate adenosyltransferase